MQGHSCGHTAVGVTPCFSAMGFNGNRLPTSLCGRLTPRAELPGL